MSEKLKTTVEELRKLICVDNIIGSPIETEEKILIPVVRIGLGFGAGEDMAGNGGKNVTGAGAGIEPVSMVMIPKKGETAEGVRVLDLSKRSDTNKAISDLSLVISDLIKEYLEPGQKNAYDDDYDESEYIEPELTNNLEIE